jgi:murein L,D-transpeptidase YafK
LKLHYVALFFLFFLSQSALSATTPDIWLLVETKTRLLRVMEGTNEKEVFTNVSIGRKGSSTDKIRNDDKTPLGEYRIGWVNDKSRFRRFFGLTYPNLDNAKKAYRKGVIGEHTLRNIMRANLDEDIPPQDTELGGQIGIHGLGTGSLQVHEEFNWTHGCIAMTNDQIDRLGQWVHKGTLVVIR